MNKQTLSSAEDTQVTLAPENLENDPNFWYTVALSPINVADHTEEEFCTSAACTCTDA